MSEEILKRIDMFAEKLGVTATHLWGVLLRQAATEARQDLVVCAAWLVICVFSLVVLRVGFKTDHDAFDEAGVPVTLIVVALFALIVASLYGFASWTEFANPEYWALTKLKDVVAK